MSDVEPAEAAAPLKTISMADPDNSSEPLEMIEAKTQLTAKQMQTIVTTFSAMMEADTDIGEMLPLECVDQALSQILGMDLTASQYELINDVCQGRQYLRFDDFIELCKELLSLTTHWGRLSTPLQGTVGFSSIGKQVEAKLYARGFEFNMMIVGEAGLGKSTFVDTLFSSQVSRRSATKDGFLEALPPTVEIHSVTHVVQEGPARMKLTVIDTPGFGDQVDNTDCWQPVIEYIEMQHSKYLDAELAVDRARHIPDSRVHACLYFIAPTGHTLKPLDVAAMRALQEVVNVIPVISKADTFMPDELEYFKQRIVEDLQFFDIRPYPHGTAMDQSTALKQIQAKIPFAIVGHNCEIPDDDQIKRGRKTKFGFIEVDNKAHTDFPFLREMMMETHTQDLIDTTDCVHYENYRRVNLQAP